MDALLLFVLSSVLILRTITDPHASHICPHITIAHSNKYTDSKRKDKAIDEEIAVVAATERIVNKFYCTDVNRMNFYPKRRN